METIIHRLLDRKDTDVGGIKHENGDFKGKKIEFDG